ncbi:MAG: hypothetical protein AAGF48_12990 [Pseudomonadota bacterium]
MTYVDGIIKAFGGVRKLASATGQAPSVVSGWKKRGSIPDPQKIRVFEAARQRGIELQPADLLPASIAAE